MQSHAKMVRVAHTYTRPHSLRKSCFIYEACGSESHKVLLRFPNCSSIAGRHFPPICCFRLWQKMQPLCRDLGGVRHAAPHSYARLAEHQRFGLHRGGSSAVIVPLFWTSVEQFSVPLFDPLFTLGPSSLALLKSEWSHWRNVKRVNPTLERGAAELRPIKQCVGLRLTWWPQDGRQVSSLAVCDKVRLRGNSRVLGGKMVSLHWGWAMIVFESKWDLIVWTMFEKGKWCAHPYILWSFSMVFFHLSRWWKAFNLNVIFSERH